MKVTLKPGLIAGTLALATVLATVGTLAFAKDAGLNYLREGKPDGSALLAPPPLMGSPEQAADMDEVKAVSRGASITDVAAANGEKKFSVFDFGVEAGSYFVETNLPRTDAFFKKVLEDAKTVTALSKDYFRRPRPYTIDPSLANGKPEKSFSYPSGHSTESMVLALVLADLIPDKAEAIIAHARAFGWHRVEIARHFPTDIYAGRVLAQAIVREFKSNAAFEKDLAEARVEIQKAQLAPQASRR
jgi:acid phosphatase (class A)